MSYSGRLIVNKQIALTDDPGGIVEATAVSDFPTKFAGTPLKKGRVEEENNQNYRKLNQIYQKFILFNDNSNNLRGNQLPAALKGRKI